MVKSRVIVVLMLCVLCVLSHKAWGAIVDLPSTLIACPDCEKAVSRRAMMCPACGCPGEAIAEAVKKMEEPPKPKPPAEVVYGISNRGRFEVIPVALAGEYRLLAPLADAAGVETLLISNEVHGVNVDYRAVKRHASLPLISFTTDYTSNIVFRTCPITIHGQTVPDDSSVWQPLSPKALRKLSQEDSL